MHRVACPRLITALLILAASLTSPVVSVGLPIDEGADQETPGLRIELQGAPEPGWSCSALEKQLAGAKRRIWLVWLQLREPREFPGYTIARQGEVWSNWQRKVTVDFTVCPSSTLPRETTKDCLGAPQDLTINEQGIDWLVTRSAMESITTSRGPLIPDECRRNHYRFHAVFQPVALERTDTIARVVRFLNDQDPSVRALAAETLGKIGREDDVGVAVALRTAQKDKHSSVSEAAKSALQRLRHE